MSDGVGRTRSRVQACEFPFRDGIDVIVPAMVRPGVVFELAFTPKLFAEILADAKFAKAPPPVSAKVAPPRRTGFISEQTLALRNAHHTATMHPERPLEEIATRFELDVDHRARFLREVAERRSEPREKIDAAVAEVMAMPRGFGAGGNSQQRKAEFLRVRGLHVAAFDRALRNARKKRSDKRT